MKYAERKEKFVDGIDKTNIIELEQLKGGFGVPKEYAGPSLEVSTINL